MRFERPSFERLKSEKPNVAQQEKGVKAQEEAKENLEVEPKPEVEERKSGVEDYEKYKVGDEVFYQGEIWRVFNVDSKPKIVKEPDWEKDPSGKTEKEMRISGVLTLVRVRGTVRDFRGVGWDFVEKVTPESRANFEKMREESGL